MVRVVMLRLCILGAHQPKTDMRLHTTLVLTVFLSAAALAPEAAAQTRSYVNGRSAADSTALPFSGGVMVGDTFYLSGTLGLGPNQTVPETAEEEAKLVLDNMRETLEAAEMTMDDLVSVQIFCSDVAHYAAFNKVYRTYFTADFPARAFIGSGALLFGARFEVMGIAARR
ncbi:MAG: 2-iminobutanoate/2-iminopropanoate deaminase [Rhodothermales bacterium]